MTEPAANRTETIRWLILQTMFTACPDGVYENLLLDVVQTQYPDADQDEVRKSMDFLAKAEMIILEDSFSTRNWFCSMRHIGIRFVNHATEAVPGIARPKKKTGS